MCPSKAAFIFLLCALMFSHVQGQNPYALPTEPIQQGTTAGPTGYHAGPDRVPSPDQPGKDPNLNNQPVTAQPAPNNGAAPLIDLTAQDSLPPAMEARPNPHIPAEDLGNGSRIGERVAHSRIVDEYEYKPEKIKVYPDDPDSAVWETNVRYTFQRAQREMKPMLLLFTASWRPEAMNLSHEVFSTKSFNNYVKENLVICYLNYPKNVRDAPKSMQWAKKEFKVAGYPSVLIFSPEGEVVRSLRGYRKGRPVDYFNKLKQACEPTLASIKARKESLMRHGFRDWQNPEGRGLFAKFVRRDDYLMTLIDAKGREWTIAIMHLSKDDKLMARSFPRLDQVVKQPEPR